MAQIKVGDITPRNQYTSAASQTAFTYAFPIFADADIKVYVGSTLKTLTTDYTVSGAGDDNGGTVTFVTGQTSGDIITLYRDMPVQRTSDYQTNGDFLADTVNDDFDKLAMMIQQVEYDLNSRTLRFGQFTTGIPLSEFTENATDRAGKVLAFDSSGDPNITQELGTYQGTDATTTTAAYSIRDIVKSTTTAQLNNIYICTAASASGTALTNASYWSLIIDAVSAASSATSASSSATAAASSATAAATSATSAATSATTATTKAATATTQATTATTQATNAATSATNAASSATSASGSATTATTKATAASTSATSAATSATTATTKAGEASTSATNAAASATTATTQASTATTQASAAAGSATSAATAKTAAETAKTAAETAQTAAELAADNFDDTYLGAKASDPTLDNDGDALTAGDLYYNTTSSELKYYNGSAWTAIVTYTHPNHSGDVVSSGDGAMTIQVDAVDIAMLSATGTASGTTFLRGDNTWVVPTDTDTVYTHPTTAGNEHLPSSVSQTEAGYLDGVTSAIQTQLDNKTDTNTTYTAGTGLDLTGTTFSIEPDLRDGITHVGRDSNDYIQIDTATIRFYINGVNVMSCDSSGNIIAKGNVTAYGTPS